MSAEPTRRLLLAAAGAASLALGGCKGLAVLGPRPSPTASVVALEHAIAAEELLVARYRAALAALPADGANGQAGGGKAGQAARAVVREVLAEHQAHLAQLRARLILPPRLATASPQPPAPPALPAGRHRVLAGLAAAEAAASDRLIAQLAVVPPELAQLMASIAAAEAVHAVRLGFGRLVP